MNMARSSSGGASGRSLSDSGSAKSRARSPDESKDGKREKKKSDIDGARPKRDGDGKKAKQAAPVISFDGTAYATVGKLKDATSEEDRRDLFCRKLRLCSEVYDFRLSETSLAEKEGKRQTLVELVEFASAAPAQRFAFEQREMQEIINMVGANVFRTLVKRERTPMDLLEGEDDDPPLDAAWPHLELVYELLLRVLSPKDFDGSVAQGVVDKAFVEKLLDLFDSDDPREREVLRTIVSRIHSRISGQRSFVRRTVQNILLRAATENEVHNGVGEMLEVLSRIISGFTTPLKPESRDLLHKVLIPLHKVEYLGMFHSQLLECTKKFTEKEPALAHDVIAALLRYWPFSMSSKQILFLSEIDDLMYLVPANQFKDLQEPLGRRLAACVAYQNSDVAEKCLAMWRSDKFIKFIMANCRDQFPSIISALYDNATQHWQGTVHTRTFEILKVLMDKDPELFDACSAKHRKKSEEAERRELVRERRWAALQELHDRKMAAGKNAAARPDVKLDQAGDNAKSTAASMVAQATSASPRRLRSSQDLEGAADIPGKKRPLGIMSPRCANQIDSAQNSSTQSGVGPFLQRNGSGSSTLLGSARSLGLTHARCGACASWDCEVSKVEIDLQVLMFDGRGRLVGAVHEENRVAAPTLIHRLDDRPALPTLRGSCSGLVSLGLESAPPEVVLLMLVVCVGSSGRLADAQGCTVHLIEEEAGTEVATFPVESPRSDVGVAGLIKRSGSSKQWSLTRVDDYSKAGRHFMDILETVIGKAVREALPSMPKKQKLPLLAFAGLADGGVVCLPGPSICKGWFVGLSWDVAPTISSNDKLAINLAILFLDAQGQLLGSCSLDVPAAFGAKHSGPGLLGQGVCLDLVSAPADASQIFVVGHLSTGRASALEGLQKPQCVLADTAGAEVLRYGLSRQSQSESGFLVGRIYRRLVVKGAGSSGQYAATAAAGGPWRWYFQALNMPCPGTNWEGSVPEVRRVFSLPPSALQPIPEGTAPPGGRCVVSL